MFHIFQLTICLEVVRTTDNPMRLYVCNEPRNIAVVSESHSLVFHQRQSRKAARTPIVSVHIEPTSQVLKSQKYSPLFQREIHGCLGLINVELQTYVAIITGAMTDVAHPVPYESVNKIFAVEFISLASNDWDFVNLDSNGFPIQSSSEPDEYDPTIPRVAHPCFELKKLLSNGSFYFSNDFDLTSLLQSRGVDNKKLFNRPGSSNIESGQVNMQHYQEQYMWNSFLMEELLKFRSTLDESAVELMNKNRFLTTVIRGFAKSIPLNSQGDTLSIISKQSWKRAGTRFNARGIDDEGYVANFVETEFVYSNLSLNQIYSFTQIRGSVPAFWEQDSALINPKITITRSIEATQPIFEKHFDGICQTYGVCHIVNLLSKTKSQEVEVLRRYKDLFLNSYHREKVAYTHFDFHAETKQLSGGFAGASKILPQLFRSLEQFGWFDFDAKQGESVTKQDGIFRVNCLDCLDRTNLIEQVVCQCVLENILKNQSYIGNHTLGRLSKEEIISKHNSLWADNGDAISQIYTGTNALKSSFSRSGKMNFAGALSDVTKSVSRMYQNTFVDSKKQSTMDFLLGRDGRLTIPVKIFDPVNEYIQGKLKQNEELYTSYSEIKIFTGTYNMNAASPNLRMDLTRWLFPPENYNSGIPDVYAVGLQELIELNAGSILNSDGSKPNLWARVIEEQLNSQGEQYSLLRSESISSLCLFLFVKKTQMKHVSHISGSSKKTGFGGITANKGACAIRFEFGSTSFALVTSHLAAGVNATIERHNDYNAILLGLTFTRNFTIGDHDHIIWLGDLNYRINLPNDRCRYLIDKGAFDDLITFDQLNQEMQVRGGAFYGFQEDQIKFYPTYKFDKGTSNYDTSEKQRVPSWTDRVLYRSTINDKITSLNYNSVMDIFESDHKPVYNTFRSRVKYIDTCKKKYLAREYFERYKAEIGDDVELSCDGGSSHALSSQCSTFSADALSDMNLLDEASSLAPKLPSRIPVVTASTLPRRVPPPPVSRRVATEQPSFRKSDSVSFSAPPSMSTKSDPSESAQKESKIVSVSQPLPPAPPPARNGSKTSIQLAFNSEPLIPSNSPSPKTASPATVSPALANHVRLNTAVANLSLKPLKPSKPQSLSSMRTESCESKFPAKSASVSTRPVPPPVRAGMHATPEKTQGRPMSDWKPLAPQ